VVDRDPTARVGRGVRFDVAAGGVVRLGPGFVVGDGCRFHVRGEVVVGEGTVLGERCVVLCEARVELGAGCRLGDETVLIDAEHRFDDVEVPVRLQGRQAAPVRVGDRVRLGPGAAVLRGAVVGAGATIGPRTVVTGAVPPGGTVLGAAAVQG
jgi:acetyltransferase-like isoleucine patch superfamily enzyme